MELNQIAWDRWKSYREVIKKPIKPVSEDAAKLKLMRFGEHQDAVVDQSIANSWQGLFALHVEKTGGEPKKKTKEQQDAASAHFEWLNRESAKEWDKRALERSSTAKLLLAEALLARYDTELEQGSIMLAEKRQWLKERVGQLILEANDPAALSDLTVRRMVLRLFGDVGLRRLEKRSETLA